MSLLLPQEVGNDAGPQQALQWLFEHENDPQAGLPLTESPSSGAGQQQIRPVIGIAGILKREQEIAAHNDRYKESLSGLEVSHYSSKGEGILSVMPHLVFRSAL